MHPHEEAIIRTFFEPSKRERYLTLLSGRRRRKTLDKLNHFAHLDRRFITELDSKTDIASLLRQHEAPATCYVISDIPEIDGREMDLDDALAEAEDGEWSTIIGCLPGKLAYYRGEYGSVRALLKK